MPGYAGSSWYFLRFMDPNNEHEFASRAATDYWNQVDIYIGGTEHAVGHLLYSRMWTKALYDLGHIGFDEPFKKLVNQGMITGNSRFAFRILKSGLFVSFNKWKDIKANPDKEEYAEIIAEGTYTESDKTLHDLKGFETQRIRVKVDIVDGFELNIEEFKSSNKIYRGSNFLREDDGTFLCYGEVEKMSKSKYNVVNPDDIITQYGADTFRMYEMFLGPLDVSKPWDTKGIEGVHRFLRKFWRLYHDDSKGWIVTDEEATEAELKALHKSIKKIEQDTERFSFNTAVSQFMILVNELSDLNCHKRSILSPLVQLICPYAPHIAEELWAQLGNEESIIEAGKFPVWEEQYVVENSKVYPVAINGKTRTELEFALDASQSDIEQIVLANEVVQKWLEGKAPKKIIFVKGKMINIVL